MGVTASGRKAKNNKHVTKQARKTTMFFIGRFPWFFFFFFSGYLFILSMQGCALWIPSVLQYIQCAQTWRTRWWNHIVNLAVWKGLQLQVTGNPENKTEMISIHLAWKRSFLIPKWRMTVTITIFFLLTHNCYSSSTFVELRELGCMWGLQLFCSPLCVVAAFTCRDIMLFSGLVILHILMFVKYLVYSKYLDICLHCQG